MNKKITSAFLAIILIFLILAAIGIYRSAQWQTFGLFSLVSVVWLIGVFVLIKKPTWSWFGLLLFLLSWGVFPLMSFIAKYVLPWSADSLLEQIDRKIWAGHILSDFLRYEEYPVFSDIITACYFFFYFLVVGSVIYFTINRKKAIGIVFFNAIITLYLIGFIGYICLPAAGPAFTISPQVGGGGQFTQSITKMVNDGVTGMDVFPSLHTAISLFIVGYLWQIGLRKISICIFPITLGTVFATIFLRYHYGIDMLCGVLIAIGMLFLSAQWLNNQQKT